MVLRHGQKFSAYLQTTLKNSIAIDADGSVISQVVDINIYIMKLLSEKKNIF